MEARKFESRGKGWFDTDQCWEDRAMVYPEAEAFINSQ